MSLNERRRRDDGRAIQQRLPGTNASSFPPEAQLFIVEHLSDVLPEQLDGGDCPVSRRLVVAFFRAIYRAEPGLSTLLSLGDKLPISIRNLPPARPGGRPTRPNHSDGRNRRGEALEGINIPFFGEAGRQDAGVSEGVRTPDAFRDHRRSNRRSLVEINSGLPHGLAARAALGQGRAGDASSRAGFRAPRAGSGQSRAEQNAPDRGSPACFEPCN